MHKYTYQKKKDYYIVLKDGVDVGGRFSTEHTCIQYIEIVKQAEILNAITESRPAR